MDSSMFGSVKDGFLGKSKQRSKTAWLMKEHGLKNERWMYVSVSYALLGHFASLHNAITYPR